MVIFVHKSYVLLTPVYISNISAITDSIFTTYLGPKTQVLLVLLLFLVVVVLVAVVAVVLVEVESFEGDFFLSQIHLMVKTISLGCVRYPIA